MKESSQCCLRRLRHLASEIVLDSDESERTWSVTLKAEASTKRSSMMAEDEWEVVTQDSEAEREATTLTSASSMPPLRRSGSAARSASASSCDPLQCSGVVASRGSRASVQAVAASSSGSLQQSGSRAEHVAGGVEQPSGSGVRSDAQVLGMATSLVEVNPDEVSGVVRRSSRAVGSSSVGSPKKSNPWNQFQFENKNKGWSTQQMRAEYYKVKSNR